MKNTRANTQASFQSRLIAFLVVLAVGFVMGWLNGRESSDTNVQSKSALVATQDTAQEQGVQDDKSQADTPAASPDAGSPEVQKTGTSDAGTSTVAPTRGPTVTETGRYTSKDEVALYIHTYGYLPSNFISKSKARDKGWVPSKGNLDKVCPGMSIGGSRFYNDEGQLPDARGRQWTECDINYHGGYRGQERIVFSNDGLIFYTGNHYKTFERLY